MSLILHRAPWWPSFDKAKVIADFSPLSLDQLWVEHLKDLVDAGVDLGCRRRI